MNTKNNAVIINGETIDLSQWLTTIEKSPNGNYTAKIELLDYSELGFIISSLIDVCRQALENENQFIDSLSLSRVLALANDLIPHGELELLTKLKNSSND